MFSIIIPLYNKAKYIEKAIYSVVNQSFKDFELIIVNDGSFDGGELIVSGLLKKYDNKDYRLVNQLNQGVSLARNNGVKFAKFEYVVFLDADDWWEPTFLEEMKVLIDKYPQARIFGCGFYKIRNGNKIVANIGVEEGFKDGLINYCKVYSKTLWMPLTSISTIIKKDVFISEEGFKPRLKLGEDFDLWIRIAMKYPVAFLNKPLANYNQDVELENRAVGGRLYNADEHMLFSDYSIWENNADFVFLFERLAVYSLLPYYLRNKNTEQVDKILGLIHWNNHTFKYRLYYRILPKSLLRAWMFLLKIGSVIKKIFLKRCLFII